MHFSLFHDMIDLKKGGKRKLVYKLFRTRQRNAVPIVKKTSVKRKCKKEIVCNYSVTENLQKVNQKLTYFFCDPFSCVSESAKLSALHALVPHVLSCPAWLVPHVLLCPTCPCASYPTCCRALCASCPTCSRALRAFVPTVLSYPTCLVPHIPRALHATLFHMPLASCASFSICSIHRALFMYKI